MAAASNPTDTDAPLLCGPAGWSYRDWEGVVYPARGRRASHPLHDLARWFDTVEVNVTFYRDVPATQVDAWCGRTASNPRFQWCFKLHQRFSHAGGVPAPARLLPALETFRPARERGCLGALLLQFPWSFRPLAAHLDALRDLAQALRVEGWPLVVEVRHAGWAGTEPAFPVVVCDQPPLPGNLTLAEAERLARAVPAGAGPRYLRLHGRNRAAWFDREAGRDRRYDYLYAPRERESLADLLRRLRRGGGPHAPVFLIANNHFRGQAVVDALVIQKLALGRRPRLPAALRDAYPDDLADFPGPEPSDPAAEGSSQPTLF